MNIFGLNVMSKRFQFLVTIILTLILLFLAVGLNADQRMKDIVSDFMASENIIIYPIFTERNWSVNNWDRWTVEQRESYLAGVQDSAEAIGFQMSRGVGPKELLHAIVELFMQSRGDIYTYIENRYEPTGSGRITRWISGEITRVLRDKDYTHAGTHLRNDILRD